MNDNNLNNNNIDSNFQNGTYRATSNLNTAIENPQVNIGNAMGINIQENGYNNKNTTDNNSTNMNNNFANSAYNTNINYQQPNIENMPNNNQNSASNYQNTTSNNDTTNQKYSYEPTINKNKKSNNTISNIIHSKEAKIMIFIVFILILFLLIMPYIYDMLIKL